ncbi:hypothetical protein F5Y14DRAFT_323702 [Nemania sp. NC0429]|nr:hypothetical protein F5Y14DRAFT_323702 [Nemania sp. NC0429]
MPRETRKMDQRSVDRISKSLGPNNGFTRRASMAVRNGNQEDNRQEADSSENQNVTEKKKDDDKQTRP